MALELRLLDYNKKNNLLFKVKKGKQKYSALFIIDFGREQVRLIKGFAPKSIKRKLRQYMHEHYDLKF